MSGEVRKMSTTKEKRRYEGDETQYLKVTFKRHRKEKSIDESPKILRRIDFSHPTDKNLFSLDCDFFHQKRNRKRLTAAMLRGNHT